MGKTVATQATEILFAGPPRQKKRVTIHKVGQI